MNAWPGRRLATALDFILALSGGYLIFTPGTPLVFRLVGVGFIAGSVWQYPGWRS